MQGAPMRNNFTSEACTEESQEVQRTSLGLKVKRPDVLKAGGLVDSGRLTFRGLPHVDGNTFMGRTTRSPITGEIRMLGKTSWPHFDLADMWTRDRLDGSLRAYLKDKHVFLPLPMPYRTWIYHDLFQERRVMSNASEHGMVHAALQVRCIDVPISAGRWSPIMCYAPILLMLCLTGDMFAVLPGICLMLVLYVMSISMNNPASYRYLRLATLFPRLGFLVVIVLRASTGSPQALAVFAYVIALIILLVDFWRGDLQVVLCYRMNCSYEIIKALPGRVFICRRHGAAHLESLFGERGKVDEVIMGMGAWNRNFYLIADINGMLAELRPVHVDDLMKMYEEWCQSPGDLKFYGLNSFSHEFPTVHSIGVSMATLSKQCRNFRATVPKDSLLYSGGGMGEAGATEEEHWAQPAQPEVKEIAPKSNPPNLVVETDF